MNKKSYADIITERYIKDNNENSKLDNYENLKDIESCFYDELNNTNIKGFPFASDFVNSKNEKINYDVYKTLSKDEKKKYRLRYYYMPLMHELYIGTTGSGKTTTCIEPQLRAISSQKNKPNIFISDPKGEIFSHNVKHLIDNGYKVQVLNFKNPNFSNTWNPLEEIYLKQAEIHQIGLDAHVIKNNEVDKSLKKIAEEKEYNKAFHIVYKNMAFPTYKSFKDYMDSKKYLAHSHVTTLVNQICIQMFPDEEYNKDPIWNDGAREFFKGAMLALLEDSIKPENEFTKEMFNIRTVNNVYTLANSVEYEYENSSSQKLKEFKKGKSKEALDKIEIVTEAPDNTRKGYLSTCESMIGNWLNGHIFSLTTTTNISLDDSKSPIALFVITRDYDKSDNGVAGLFLNWVYSKFLEKAEKEERIDGVNSSRPLHFLLDEFANIPAISDFETKIATSRSRNIYFHIFLQSYEQLNAIYDEDIANIIINNCNQQVFLGSQSYKSKERFSKECGKKTIKLVNPTSQEDLNLIDYAPTIPLSKLNNVESGHMYLKRINMDVFESHFVRSYELANEGIFKNFDEENFEKYLPYNSINPDDSKYIYKGVIPDENDKDKNFNKLFKEDL